MAAGMKIVAAVVDVFQAMQVIRHGLDGKFPCPLRLGAAIQCVRRMGQDGREMVLRHERVDGLHIVEVQRLRRAAARVAGEELECVGADGKGFLAHVAKAL